MKNQIHQFGSKVFICASVIALSTGLAMTPNFANAEDDMMGKPPAQPQEKSPDSMDTDHDKMMKDHDAMEAKDHKKHKKQMQQQKDAPMKDAPMMDDDAMAPDMPQDSGMSEDM